MLQLIVDFTSVVMCYVFGIVDFHTIIESAKKLSVETKSSEKTKLQDEELQKIFQLEKSEVIMKSYGTSKIGLRNIDGTLYITPNHVLFFHSESEKNVYPLMSTKFLQKKSNLRIETAKKKYNYRLADVSSVLKAIQLSKESISDVINVDQDVEIDLKMNEDDWNELFRDLAVINHESGFEINSSENIYYIQQGKVEIFQNHNSLGVVGEKNLFGHISNLTKKSDLTYKAIEKVSVFKLKKEYLDLCYSINSSLATKFYLYLLEELLASKSV